MTPPKPTIRNCPFCRIAMVGSRSSPDKRDLDIFECLHCDTVIRLDGPPAHTDEPRGRE